MKHIYLLLLLILFLPFSYSTLTMYNSNFEKSNLYSMKDLNYIIASDVNNSVKLNYAVPMNTSSSQELEVELNLTLCNIEAIEEKYCLQDSIGNYIQSSNTSFLGSLIFNYKQNTNTQKIYLDMFAPTINIDYSINSTKKTLAFEVNVSDNLNYTINTTIEIFQTPVNSLEKKSIFSNSSINSYINSNISLSETGNYTIQVLSEDLARNSKVEVKKFEVQDIFAPKITNFKILNLIPDNNYINFLIEDSSQIDSWELELNSRQYSQDYTDSRVFEDNVSVLVELNELSSYIELTTKDNKNNSITDTYFIRDKIEISHDNLFSDELVISAINSDSCILRSGIAGLENEIFTKSNSDFMLSINSLDNEEYDAIVRCENENYVREEQVSFEVDTTPPIIMEFKLRALDNGEIEVLYEASEDVNELEIFRDDREIESIRRGDFKGTFRDSKVDYREDHKYFLLVRDEAGNKAESEELTITPKKASINFSSKLVDDEDLVTISFLSERDLKADLISLEALNFTINSFDGIVIENTSSSRVLFKIEDESSKITILKSNDSLNLRLNIEDDYNNSLTNSFIVNQLGFETSQSEQNIQTFNDNRDVESRETSLNKNPELNNSLEEGNLFLIKNNSLVPYSLLLWLLFFLIFLLIIILIIKNISYLEDKYNKHKAYLDLKKKRSYKNEYSHSFFTKSYSGFKSSSLDKEINKRIVDKKNKEQELKKEQEKLKRRNKEKALKTKSAYEQQKYMDLNKNKNFSVPVNTLKTKKSKLDLNKKNKNQKFNLNIFSFIKSFSLENNKIMPKKGLNNISNIQKNDDSQNIFDKKITTTYKYSKSFNPISQKDVRKDATVAENNESILGDTFEEKDQITNITSNKNNNKIDWGDYLEKKSKSRRWFLLQKEVDKETKE